MLTAGSEVLASILICDESGSMFVCLMYCSQYQGITIFEGDAAAVSK